MAENPQPTTTTPQPVTPTPTPTPQPTISDFQIFFPYTLNKSCFDREIYTPELTENRATTEEVNTVLDELESAVEPTVKAAKTYLGIYMGFFLTTNLILPFLYERSERFQKMLSARALIIGNTTIIGLATVKFFYTMKGKESEARELSLKVFDKYNTAFMEKGLRWNIPKNFPKGVGLWRLYKGDPRNYLPQAPNPN